MANHRPVEHSYQPLRLSGDWAVPPDYSHEGNADEKDGWGGDGRGGKDRDEGAHKCAYAGEGLGRRCGSGGDLDRVRVSTSR